MPIYQFKCRSCRKEIEIYRKMSDSSLPCDCPVCGLEADRQIAPIKQGTGDYHKPIEMQSVAATNLSELRQLQEAGIEVCDDPKSELFGVPIARNLQQKRKILKTVGYEDLR